MSYSVDETQELPAPAVSVAPSPPPPQNPISSDKMCHGVQLVLLGGPCSGQCHGVQLVLLGGPCSGECHGVQLVSTW